MKTEIALEFQLEVEAYLQERCIELKAVHIIEKGKYVEIKIYDWCSFSINLDRDDVNMSFDITKNIWMIHIDHYSRYTPTSIKGKDQMYLLDTLPVLLKLCKKYIADEN